MSSVDSARQHGHSLAFASSAGWDGLKVHGELIGLISRRCRFRMQRTWERIRSPRRIMASSLAILFFILYLLNGVYILSARAPADPERLRLWLSGGMLIYAIYHSVRCGWSHEVSDLRLTTAEDLWLGTAPIERSSLAVYHVNTMLMPALLKTLLLTVVLARDVTYVPLMMTGMFTSLLLLENVRLIVGRWVSAMNSPQRSKFRVAVSCLATALGLQVFMRTVAMTPSGSSPATYVLQVFQALGETAASECVQWLALPWLAAAQLTVTQSITWVTALQLLGCVAALPLATMTLVQVDRYGRNMQVKSEQRRLRDGDYRTSIAAGANSAAGLQGGARESCRHPFWGARLPAYLHEVAALVARQWITVRRYRWSIVSSFTVPTLLCLSPMLTGQGWQQWFFVVGGIALCTILLAPPALRIDFRRDLKRMLLLKGLPVKPSAMVLGQVTLPILITCVFQWITLMVAAVVIEPTVSQLILWTGTLTALAVFTFAVENALFLAFPYQPHAEGLAMLVRAKLTFLGKAAVIAMGLSLLVAWSVLCQRMLPSSLVMPCFVSGAIMASWLVAIASIKIATICWQRFDICLDTPPS